MRWLAIPVLALLLMPLLFSILVSFTPSRYLELLELALAFLLVDSATLLDSARDLIALAGDRAQRIIGEPAPPFSQSPAELLPLAFQTIPVHVDLLPLRTLT